MSIIKLCNFSFSYNKGKSNEVKAIQNISLDISKGDFVGIVGASGSGKSTLLYLLAGLLEADEGKYIYGNTDITHASDNKKASLRNTDFGFVLQDFALLGDRTALENVCLPLMFSKCKWSEVENRALKIMEKLNVEKLKNKRIGELSGGQCQRIAIARALVHNPKVILADEPTGALDSENTKILMDLLSEINSSGITVILVTHDLATLSHCNRVYELQDGVLSTRKDVINETI